MMWKVWRGIHRWLLLDFFASLASFSRCSSSTLDSSANTIDAFLRLLLLHLLCLKGRRLKRLLRFTRSVSSMPSEDIPRIVPNRITGFIVILHRLHTHRQSLPERTKAFPWTRIVRRFVSKPQLSIPNSIDTSATFYDSMITIPPSCSHLPRLSLFFTVISMFYHHRLYSCSLFIFLAIFVVLMRKCWLFPPFFKRIWGLTFIHWNWAPKLQSFRSNPIIECPSFPPSLPDFIGYFTEFYVLFSWFYFHFVNILSLFLHHFSTARTNSETSSCIIFWQFLYHDCSFSSLLWLPDFDKVIVQIAIQ